MKIFILNLLAILFFLPIFSFSQPVLTDHVEIELVAEVKSIQPDMPFWVALRINIIEDWHIYWINPGDAGLAPSIEWQLPEGFMAGEIQWPYPKKIMLGHLANYGYENEVYLLTRITPSVSLKEGETIEITAKVDWLVCKEECLPEEATLRLKLPVKAVTPRPNSLWIEKFAQTRSQLPLKFSDWQITAIKQDTSFYFNLDPPDWHSGELSNLIFFPYNKDLIQNAENQILETTNTGFRLWVQLSPMLLELPDSVSGIFVSQEGWRGPGSEKALQIAIPLDETDKIHLVQSNNRLSNLWLALIFAFLGGIILNLMPCVLPVLSLKILGFVQQAGENRRKTFQHSMVFSFGVLISFWILAAGLILLRAGGEQLGWGFQLQSPSFIFILAAFFFLFALNLFGVFEFGTSLMGVGQKPGTQAGWIGSFMSGVTATVVATPCTAPFMGSALGFALTQPVYVSVLVFTFLGLGMSFPYVLLTSIPSLLRFVPKPGPWMETLKQFMGFLLIATVIWLLWVLGIQTGVNGILITLIGMLIISIAAWILGRWGDLTKKQFVRFSARLTAGIFVINSFALSLSALNSIDIQDNSNTIYGQDGKIKWEPFTMTRVEDLRRTGQPVFIDFTAAWCLSCQVNERVAFGSADVQQKFEDLNIVALKADWTTKDEKITRALANYGRNSVPLYVLYGTDKNQEPIILPEIITPDIVMGALEKIN